MHGKEGGRSSERIASYSEVRVGTVHVRTHFEQALEQLRGCVWCDRIALVKEIALFSKYT